MSWQRFWRIENEIAWRLSHATKQWIMDTLKSGKSPTQVIVEHKIEVMQHVENTLPATRDTFIMHSDVYNITNKLVKKLWEKHPNDAMSVRMWTEKNPDSWYYQHEYGNLELNEPPPSEDDLFCLAIQTDWQLEMMVKHSHRSALSMDVTFYTNFSKVCLFATQFSFHSYCVLVHSLLLYFSKMKLDLI